MYCEHRTSPYENNDPGESLAIERLREIKALLDQRIESATEVARNMVAEELMRVEWTWVTMSMLDQSENYARENKWVNDGLTWSSRSYNLFAALAGVRSYDSGLIPISQPRGVPDDISPMVMQAFKGWELDGHTHSWLGLDEILKFKPPAGWDDNTRACWKEFVAGPVGLAKKLADEKNDSYKNWRWVFWFDN
jgi:hypothetical protein